MLTMNVSACHDVAIIDLTNLESCRSFRQSLDNSACEGDVPDDEQGKWDDGDNWSDDEDNESDSLSCSAWKGMDAHTIGVDHTIGVPFF
jgi:hypothetical protein